ncbi:hypothetical protein GMSM_45450 [Geomonas sp. Red276]
MVKGSFDLTGKEAVYLSNVQRYLSGLYLLELYRNPPTGFPTLEELAAMVAKFKELYEAAINFDRLQIKRRNEVRKALTVMFKKVGHYLQTVAEEEDTVALLQIGFNVHAPRKRNQVVVQTAQ